MLTQKNKKKKKKNQSRDCLTESRRGDGHIFPRPMDAGARPNNAHDRGQSIVDQLVDVFLCLCASVSDP